MRPPAVILLSAFGSLALGVVVILIEARLATAATSSSCASTTPCVQQMQVRLAPAEPRELSAQLPGRSTTLVDVPGAGEFSRGVYIAKAMPRTHQVDWGVFNRAGGAASGFGSVGHYGVVRWAEDWSVLRDPTLRRADDDPFDALKYIPLNENGSVYLTLSGEERLKNWFENRPGIGTIRPKDSGRMTLRSIYGADLHIGPHLRLYGELISASAGGWGGYGYSAGYRTRLDLQQGFVEFTDTIFGAKSGVMLGRMDFIDAPDYVFYLRTVSSVPESWNGGRAYMVWPRVRIDLFDFIQTDINPPAMFHDRPSWGTRLYGAYGSYALPDFRFMHGDGHVFLDLFYFGYLFNGALAAITAPSGTQAGATHRDNYGTRLWGKAGPIEFSLGVLYQGGQFSEAGTDIVRPVSAFSINTSVGWRFSHVVAHPLLGIQADLYSGGNRNRISGTVGTYTTPFVPLSSYLDTSYYTGTSNLVALSPVIETDFSKYAVLRMKAPVLWRDHTNDAFYSPGGPYKFLNYSGGYIGVVPQAMLSLRLSRHLRWNHDFARFFVSNGLRKAGASDGTYYLSTLSVVF